MKIYRTVLTILGLSVILSTTSSANVVSETIISNYINIATANYKDAVNDAKSLEIAINNFAKKPSKEGLEKSKKAWRIARESYGTTEAFRLSGGPIDAEDGWVKEAYSSPEAQLNAWPLDENMIDYTMDADGKKTSGNIIDTKGDFNPGGEGSRVINVDSITVESITALNENGGAANVATGYHAVEFLLWGQDQDYSNFLKDSVSKGAMVAGQRPLSDFVSDRYAKRRLSYLQAASSKIVSDLQKVATAWSPHISKNCEQDAQGCYRAAINNQLTGADAVKNIPLKKAYREILSGMGVFIKSELANERIAVAVLTPSEEDETSCFSDNTHRDIASNYQGFKNVLTGRYKGIEGKSFLDRLDVKTAKKIKALMLSIEKRIASIDAVANTEAHFDYQIRPNNPQARVIIALKNKMRKLGDMMLEVAKQNGIDLRASDVTDADETEL